MPLLALSPIVSVKVKYLWKKPDTPLLYYRRRIPDDVKRLLEASGSEWAGKAQIVISLQTDDPKAAVPKIAKLAAKHDQEWERLRNPSKAGLLTQAETLLRNKGIDPAAPKADVGTELIFYDWLEESLPVKVREALEEAYENGVEVDPKRDVYPYLPPVATAALQMPQQPWSSGFVVEMVLMRHTMKDLLRAVQCPDSIQDQILGHTTKGTGAGYGKGYPLEVLSEWVNKAVAAVWA